MILSDTNITHLYIFKKMLLRVTLINMRRKNIKSLYSISKMVGFNNAKRRLQTPSSGQPARHIPFPLHDHARSRSVPEKKKGPTGPGLFVTIVEFRRSQRAATEHSVSIRFAALSLSPFPEYRTDSGARSVS